MWPAFRIAPPPLKQSDELSWVLVRAFAPVDARAPARAHPQRVVALSRDLDLAARIATRHSSTLLEQIGGDAARDLAFNRLQAVAVDRLLCDLTNEVVHTAAALGSPVILLKHAALRRSRLVLEGERNARDVDVLVTPTMARLLHGALLARGFVSNAIDSKYHLAALKRGPGEVVEIHEDLWGLVGPDAGPAGTTLSAAQLIDSDLTNDLGDGAHAPKSPVLAAHAIVHGLVQHRTSPEGYPIMRMLADLCALRLNDVEEARALTLVAQFIERDSLRSALGLARALARGTDLATVAGTPNEHALLSHIVASCCDDGYRRALRFERVAELRTPQGRERALGGLTAVDDASSRAAQQGLRRFGQGAERARLLAVELLRGGASYLRAQLRRH